jgi:hypothetical protein
MTAVAPSMFIGTGGHPGHGRDHPVSWCRYYDGGRSWVTTLGHAVEAWTYGFRSMAYTWTGNP